MDKEAMKNEAIKRLKCLDVHPNVISDFKSDTVNVSHGPLGALFWATDDEKKYIKELEDTYNCVVYHAIKSFTNIGEMLTLLTICDEKDEWSHEYTRLKHGFAFAYVYNLSMPWCSEWGTVQVDPIFGGVIRIQ